VGWTGNLLPEVAVKQRVRTRGWTPAHHACGCGHPRPATEPDRAAARRPQIESSMREGQRKGGCSAPHAVDPVSIPHDIEKRRVTTGTDPEPNPQADGLFVPPLQVSESAGSTSQGGDTGSNPVGTTLPNLQVTGQFGTKNRDGQATRGPIDPVNIPCQVRTRRLRSRSGDTGPCRSIRVLPHHRQGYAVRKPCLHLPGVGSRDLITRSRIAGFVPVFVGDLVGASPVTGLHDLQ
jgi:hypothetical protein